ncbi:unnamed protein product, partial [Mesorhabditis belari]|uniref:Uncharacterized protein n=1 Tax=Mesorhabditis belari TaxID=2138241 RepID=A0AAF3ELM0_9BILA
MSTSDSSSTRDKSSDRRSSSSTSVSSSHSTSTLVSCSRDEKTQNRFRRHLRRDFYKIEKYLCDMGQPGDRVTVTQVDGTPKDIVSETAHGYLNENRMVVLEDVVNQEINNVNKNSDEKGASAETNVDMVCPPTAIPTTPSPNHPLTYPAPVLAPVSQIDLRPQTPNGSRIATQKKEEKYEKSESSQSRQSNRKGYSTSKRIFPEDDGGKSTSNHQPSHTVKHEVIRTHRRGILVNIDVHSRWWVHAGETAPSGFEGMRLIVDCPNYEPTRINVNGKWKKIVDE